MSHRGDQLFPSTIWVSGIKLRSSNLVAKCSYQLSHLTGLDTTSSVMYVVQLVAKECQL